MHAVTVPSVRRNMWVPEGWEQGGGVQLQHCLTVQGAGNNWILCLISPPTK